LIEIHTAPYGLNSLSGETASLDSDTSEVFLCLYITLGLSFYATQMKFARNLLFW